jgi:hypothetical protein
VTVKIHTILLQSEGFQKTILDKSEPVPFMALEYWLCQFIYFGVGARRLAESSGARIC